MGLFRILIYDGHGYMTVNICQKPSSCGPQRMNFIVSKNIFV